MADQNDDKTVIVEKERSFSGPVVAVIVVVVLVLLVLFLLPYLTGGGSPTNTTDVNVTPTGTGQ